MKIKLFLLLSFLATILNCYPQSGIVGYDQYRSYKKNLYFDNILKDIIPDNLNTYYYSRLNDKDLINKSQEYDTIQKEHNVYVYTKKAKDGYLCINENLTNHIKSGCYKIDKLGIVYLLNDNFINNKKDVFRLLFLRKKNIKNIESNYLIEKNILELKIYTH